jgi:hypothetical protein
MKPTTSQVSIFPLYRSDGLVVKATDASDLEKNSILAQYASEAFIDKVARGVARISSVFEKKNIDVIDDIQLVVKHSMGSSIESYNWSLPFQVECVDNTFEVTYFPAFDRFIKSKNSWRNMGSGHGIHFDSVDNLPVMDARHHSLNSLLSPHQKKVFPGLDSISLKGTVDAYVGPKTLFSRMGSYKPYMGDCLDVVLCERGGTSVSEYLLSHSQNPTLASVNNKNYKVRSDHSDLGSNSFMLNCIEDNSYLDVTVLTNDEFENLKAR